MMVSLSRKHLLVRPEELDSTLKMRFSPQVLDFLLNPSASLKCKPLKSVRAD